MKFKRRAVKRLRKTRRAKVEARQRLIYEYWDGAKKVRADPMQITMDFVAYPNLMPQQDIELMKIDPEGNPKLQKDVASAYTRVLGAIRQAFKIKSFADGGLTDLECMDEMTKFNLWMADQKKTLGILPTSPKPTASPGNSPTQNGSACGPISPESKPCEVSPSPKESPLPLEAN